MRFLSSWNGLQQWWTVRTTLAFSAALTKVEVHFPKIYDNKVVLHNLFFLYYIISTQWLYCFHFQCQLRWSIYPVVIQVACVVRFYEIRLRRAKTQDQLASFTLYFTPMDPVLARTLRTSKTELDPAGDLVATTLDPRRLKSVKI